MTALEQLFLDVVNLSVTASWVIAVVLILRLILKPVPKKYVCLLWFVVLFRLLCPVTLESEFSFVPQHEEIKYEIVYTTPQIETDSAPVNDVLNQTVNPVLQESSAPNPMGSVNPLQVYIFIAAWLWVIGIAVLCGYTLFSWIGMKRRLAEAVPDGGSVYLSDRITSPFVFGIVKPNIYLPFGLEEEERRWVLLHEQSHLARKDFIVKPIFWLAVILHWMNPLVWIAWHCYSRDVELACDERATESMNSNEKWNYSNTLLQLATEKRTLHCPVAFSNNGVKQRIERILKYKKLPTVIIGVVLVVLIICGMGLLMNPKPVMTLGEYRPSLMQQYEKNESITIEWGSVTVKISDPVQMNKLKTQLADVQVKKYSAQEETRDTGGMIILPYEKDEEDGVMQSQIAFNTDCSIIYGGDDLQILKPEVFQYILWKHCRNAIYQYPETSYYADLNHDGNDECIVININEWDTMDRVRMAVYEQSGTILFNRDLYGAHAGWGNYFLCEQDGKDYLLEFMPTMYQGYATYSWKLMDFDAKNELRVVEEDSVDFSINPEQFYEFDADAIYAFLQETENMLTEAMLLVSVENGELQYSTVAEPKQLTLWYYLDWLTSEVDGGRLEQMLYDFQHQIFYERPAYLLTEWLTEKQGYDVAKYYLDNPKLIEIDGDHSVSFEWKQKSDNRLIGIYGISTMDTDDGMDVDAGRNFYQYDMANDKWLFVQNTIEQAKVEDIANSWAQTYAERDGQTRYNLLSDSLQRNIDGNNAYATEADWMPYWTENKETLVLGGSSPWVQSWKIEMSTKENSYVADIIYTMTDSTGEHYFYGEQIQIALHDGITKVTSCEETIVLQTAAIYEQVQEILENLQNGHESWRLEPVDVVVAFVHDYLQLSDGKVRVADANKNAYYYEIDGEQPVCIYLYQPVSNQDISGCDFWAVKAYEYPDMSQYGTDGTRFYDVQLNKWASLHIKE